MLLFSLFMLILLSEDAKLNKLLLQTFEAVNGKTGELLWRYKDDAGANDEVDVMNLYTGQFIDDLNGDGVADIVNIHGGDPFAQPGQFSTFMLCYF